MRTPERTIQEGAWVHFTHDCSDTPDKTTLWACSCGWTGNEYENRKSDKSREPLRAQEHDRLGPVAPIGADEVGELNHQLMRMIDAAREEGAASERARALGMAITLAEECKDWMQATGLATDEHRKKVARANALFEFAGTNAAAHGYGPVPM